MLSITRYILSSLKEALQIGFSAHQRFRESHKDTLPPSRSLPYLTPTSTADTIYDGSIMITASHLPYNRNGFKFFDKTAGFEKKEITDLLSRAAEEAAGGSLEEDPGFPTDKRQSEASEVAKLEETLKLDKSLVSKVCRMCFTVR